MVISLREHPTLALRLGPMAELHLYKIAHPQSFAISRLVRLNSYDSMNNFKEKAQPVSGLCIENATMRHRVLCSRPACPKTVGLHAERSNYSANCTHERLD
jgi:hypothetical protein